MIKFYFINLDRSVDRAEYMNGQFAALGIAAERVTAVDAATITNSYLEDMVHPDGEWLGQKAKRIRTLDGRGSVYSPLLGRYITTGEVACYLSHARVLSIFIASGAESACIFEDDVELSPNLLVVVGGLHRKIRHAVVKLEGIFRYAIDLRWPVAKIADTAVLFRFKPTAGSAAYFLTRSSAQVLMKSMFPIREPFDGWFRQYWRHRLPVYEVSPFVATQSPQFASVILNRSAQPKGEHALVFRLFPGPIKLFYKTLRVVRRVIFFCTMIASRGRPD